MQPGAPALLEYDVAGTSLELYVTSPQAAADGAQVLQEVVLKNEYLDHGIQLEPGSLVVDVGAHIGLFGVKALLSVPHGDLTYIGIEPCPSTFQALRCNLLGPSGQGTEGSFFHYNVAYSSAVQAATADRLSAPYPGNIQLFNKAVSSQPGQQFITYYPHMPSNSTINPEEKLQLQSALTPARFFSDAQLLPVDVATLDLILKEAGLTGRHISLLKVDVEGHELEVLQGMSKETWQYVQQMVVEVHDVLDGQQTVSSSPPYQLAKGPAVATATPSPTTAATHMPDEASCQTDAATVTTASNTLSNGTRGDSADRAAAPSLCVCGSSRPKPGGRVMRGISLLQSYGFHVVVKSVLGLPTNFVLYAIK